MNDWAEVADALRAAGYIAWSRPSPHTMHTHVITEPTRRPGQTARQYRRRRRAWRRFQQWQRRQHRRMAGVV